jgi:amino acid transporter
LVATVLVTGVVLALALWFPIEPLAEATSIITPTVFTVVNLALWRIKARDPRPEGARVFPAWIPVAGCLISATFLALELTRLLAP